MPIKRSSIENLKSRVSLLDVAGKYTQLKKRGTSYVGLSPFVKEKSPSFYVEPGKNVFYCFSTNRGGDLISFVQEMEKMDFYEAVEALAERYNVELEYEEGKSGAPRVDRSLKKELHEIHLYAEEFFAKAFHAKHPEADAVREYWTTERKFSLKVAEDFKVGYAPADSKKLEEQLIKRNFSIEAMKASGLFFAPGKARFRGRLIIPLRDVQGNTIAFTGRKLPQTPKDDPAFEAKYVNSPETPIFKKGAMLFNFDRARAAVEKQGFFLMVEGQLDTLRVSSCGYPAVIAPQGTAITPEQLTLIHRYDARLKVFLDGDRAGQAAALRMLPMALAAELDVSFLKLPQGIDPDLYFLEKDEEALKGIKELGPIPFLIEAKWPTASATVQAKTKALGEIFEIIAMAPSAIAHEAYLEELIRLTRMEPRSVRIEFEKQLKKPGVRNSENTDSIDSNVTAKNTKNFNKNLTTAEVQLLWLLVHQAQLAARVATILDPSWLDEKEEHATLLNALLAEAQEGAWNNSADVTAGIERIAAEKNSRDFLFGLLARPLDKKDDASYYIEMANNCVRAIHQKHLKKELETLRNRLAEADKPAAQAELLKQQQFLLNSSKKIRLLQ